MWPAGWKMAMPLYRHKDMDRVLEYHCKAEESEANGNFEEANTILRKRGLATTLAPHALNSSLPPPIVEAYEHDRLLRLSAGQRLVVAGGADLAGTAT